MGKWGPVATVNLAWAGLWCLVLQEAAGGTPGVRQAKGRPLRLLGEFAITRILWITAIVMITISTAIC